MPASALEGSVDKYVQEWDFARDGGAIGAIDFRGPKIPNGFRITSTFIEVLTGLTGGTNAEIAISMNTAGDLKASAVLTAYASAGVVAGIPVGTAATAVKATANRTITLNVTVAALTAGKLRLVHYGYHTSK
jgi:hypothetical protein